MRCLVLARPTAAGFLTRSGPFAWHGLFVFWFPIVVFTVWMFAIAYTLIRSLKAQATAEQASAKP